MPTLLNDSRSDVGFSRWVCYERDRAHGQPGSPW
jgi:hypothetical protein